MQAHVLALTRSAENRNLFAAAMARLAAAEVGVSTALIGSHHVVGYNDDTTTGAEYLELIEHCCQRRCTDPLAGLVAGLPGLEAASSAAPPATARSITERIRVPLLGEMQLRRLSLPALTVLLAALDGFNPFAMWTLVLLLGLLLGMKDRRGCRSSGQPS